MTSLPTEDLLGFNVVTKDAGQCVAQVMAWLNAGERNKYFACANPHALEVAANDQAVTAALRDADLLTPDGVGVLIASRLKRGKIRDRVTGSSMFYGVMRALNDRGGGSVFFLGSSDEHLVEIQQKCAEDYPNIRVAGVYSPPFKPEFSEADNQAMIDAVNAAKPDVLWVGMTAPKQELWISQNRHRMDVGFFGAVGAVFDFYTGRVKRSHPFFRRMGLEWLPRLFQQPGRLWRRTIVSAPKFLWRVMNHSPS
ncbi:MAG: WecB/TagA/CpsF family glycosyltransferase [Pseudomonadota bacterium]